MRRPPEYERRRIDNTPLRERFRAMSEAGLIDAFELSQRLGMQQSSDLKRALGIKPEHSRGAMRLRRTNQPELAARIARGLGLDPWEVGL